MRASLWAVAIHVTHDPVEDEIHLHWNDNGSTHNREEIGQLTPTQVELLIRDLTEVLASRQEDS
jgi:hypothetical protein